MKRPFLWCIESMVLVAVFSTLVYGQGSSTSSLSGSVSDPSGAVISGAEVKVRNHATSAEFKALTAGNGTFSIPALDAGTYTVTVYAQGFKQAVISDVKLDAGVPGSVRVSLEIGSTSDSVVVQGGGEVMQTQSANISTTLNVNQIANLPLVSRNALNFVTLLPGTSTTRGNRDSTINGLPQSSISISIDGVNTNDKYLRSSDGFFSMINPSLDSIEEVTVSTATPGAESAGQGAVQIKFVTRQGNNEYHGSVYEYHRNPWLNSNYWFNNRDLPPDPETGKAPRNRVLFNQYGFRMGGPLRLPKKAFGPLGFDGRDRAFFFVNYEEFRQPTQITRQRTILSPEAERGIFRYNVTANGQTQVQQVNLLSLTDIDNPPATMDPVIRNLLADIRRSTTTTGGIEQLSDPNLQRFTFTNNSAARNYAPTLRLDFNLTSKHHLETVYNYIKAIRTIDALNGIDPIYPDFPNKGGAYSDRFTFSLALRSTLTTTLVNEARFGLAGGTSSFRPELSPEMFNGPFANQGGFNLGGAPGNNATGIAIMGINGPTSTNTTSRRNTPFKQFSDNLTWTRAAHSITFGGAFTQTDLWLFSQTMVPTINFGVADGDPAASLFSSESASVNFPGASAAVVTRARNFYAALTGRVIAINANAQLDEETGQYLLLGPNVQRARQREFGTYVQDSWRARPNLTLNYGLRWQVQLPFTPLNNNYTTTTIDDLYGDSGPTGHPTQFVQFNKGDRAYNVDYRNFAPTFGFAWSPNAKKGWLKRIVGQDGQTVLRGGYSIAYDMQGMATFSDRYDDNPGSFVTASRSTTIGNLGDQLPVLLRDSSRLGAAPFPSSPTYPIIGTITNSARIFDPNLKVPYVQSWTFGIQREINKETAVEVRYVGNRYLRGWIDYDLNDGDDVTVVENGFLDEFKLAMDNLQANIRAGRGGTFAYTGVPGTSPLPTFLAYFNGIDAAGAGTPANYTSTLFTDSNFVSQLAMNNPDLYAIASSNANTGLFGNETRRANAERAGLPPNFFLVNPGLQGGATFTGNGSYNRYDSMVVELRRRLSRGLLVQGSYTFAKGFISTRVSRRAPRVNTFGTDANSVPHHAFKVNWVYELPFGRGRTFFGGAGSKLDRLIGGWEFHGAARIQSGEILNMGNVNLVGMTQKDLQKAFKLRFDDDEGIVYSLPQDIIDNTIRAFNVSATSPTGYGQLGPPTGRYIAPANSRSCIQVVEGDCAPQAVFVYGPRFARFDLSAVKRVRITERVNFELRGEFLNAFNHINFFADTNLTNFNNQLFGQLTSAYRDTNNTNDPGGRLIQIVARLNF